MCLHPKHAKSIESIRNGANCAAVSMQPPIRSVVMLSCVFLQDPAAAFGDTWVFGEYNAFGVPKQAKEPFLSPLQDIWATTESQTALKMGCFGAKNQSKMEQNCVFPKILLTYLGSTNKWNEPILSAC